MTKDTRLQLATEGKIGSAGLEIAMSMGAGLQDRAELIGGSCSGGMIGTVGVNKTAGGLVDLSFAGEVLGLHAGRAWVLLAPGWVSRGREEQGQELREGGKSPCAHLPGLLLRLTECKGSYQLCWVFRPRTQLSDAVQRLTAPSLAGMSAFRPSNPHRKQGDPPLLLSRPWRAPCRRLPESGREEECSSLRLRVLSCQHTGRQGQ